MPFTLAHVAAVLPLLRRRTGRLSATGLVIGSVAPDFEKFLRLGLHNGHSHTWASLLYFSCPVALGLAFLFHGVVRDPLLAHLPRPLRQRLSGLPRVAWGAYFRRHYVVVLASILLGAGSHLLWDGLTHKGGLRGLPYPVLALHLPPPAARLTVYSVLDVLSSVGGVALVSWLIIRLPCRPVAEVPARLLRRYWVVAAGTAAGLFGLRQLLDPAPPDVWNVLISALSAGMAGVVVASVWCAGSWSVGTKPAANAA